MKIHLKEGNMNTKIIISTPRLFGVTLLPKDFFYWFAEVDRYIDYMETSSRNLVGSIATIENSSSKRSHSIMEEDATIDEISIPLTRLWVILIPRITQISQPKSLLSPKFFQISHQKSKLFKTKPSSSPPHRWSSFTLSTTTVLPTNY